MIILFYLFRLFTWIMAFLPLRILYLTSDFFRPWIQYVFRYRRKTTLNNLKNSFPEKNKAEIRAIMRDYYRNLTDISLEVIKLQRMKPEDLKQRFSFTGIDIIERSFSNGRSVIVAIGHCGNWEWMGTALGHVTSVRGFAIVKPLSHRHFDTFMTNIRHRLNPDSTINFRHAYRSMLRHKREFISFNVLAADQTPTREEINYWSKFLNQETSFFLGIEKLARSMDLDVVFIDIQRIKRGYYKGEVSLITDDPKITADFEIMELYIRMLERSIRNNPDNWLWSHRRWKHEKIV